MGLQRLLDLSGRQLPSINVGDGIPLQGGGMGGGEWGAGRGGGGVGREQGSSSLGSSRALLKETGS